MNISCAPPGSAVKFAGFLVVYEEAKNEDVKAEEEEENVKIPAGVAEGQKQELIRLIPEQHFTQPPPRYSEASLVQALEEDGIGRPSTYAPTISTIQQRGYVVREEKRLMPTEIGIQVNDLMVQYFSDIVDFKFTARMEEDLDMIANGQAEWVEVMHEFYHPFAEDLKKAQAEMPVTKSGPEPIGRICPKTAASWSSAMGALGNSSRARTSQPAGIPNPGWRRSASSARRMAASCGAQDAQGTHLLWLRELSQLRFHLLEAAAQTALPEMRRPARRCQQTRSPMYELPGDLPVWKIIVPEIC